MHSSANWLQLDLPQLDIRFCKHLGRVIVHSVRFAVDDFANATLHNFDCASQTRTTAFARHQRHSHIFQTHSRIAKQSSTFASSPPSFQQGILLIFSISLCTLSSNRTRTSACKHKHSCMSTPLLTGPAKVVALHLAQPPCAQFLIPLGVPLYPVDTTVRNGEIKTAPTLLFIQFDLQPPVNTLFLLYYG